MATVITKVLFLVINFYICYSVDRSTFSNLRATEEHDGYMQFEQDIHLPLSVKWTKVLTKHVPCSWSIVVANGALYCVTNIFEPNPSIVAFNVDDGSLLFETNFNHNASANYALSGIVFIEPNYISVVDNINAKIYLLNASTGDIIHEKLLYDGCPLQNTKQCIESTIVSSPVDRHSVIVSYSVNNYDRFFLWNIESNDISYADTSYCVNSAFVPPTICHNDTIVVANPDCAVGAFYIDPNNTAFPIWEYEIDAISDGGGRIDPVFCIPTVEGGFNVLVNVLANESLHDRGLQRWNLIDGKTGELIKEIIWNKVPLIEPSIHTDKMILATAIMSGTCVNESCSDVRETVVGYNITDHSQWTEMYKITMSETYYQDMMVINDNIFALGVISNDLIYISHYVLDVFSIDNGEHVERFTLPLNIKHAQVDTSGSMVAGSGNNGTPMVFVQVALYYNSYNIYSLFALGSSFEFEAVNYNNGKAEVMKSLN